MVSVSALEPFLKWWARKGAELSSRGLVDSDRVRSTSSSRVGGSSEPANAAPRLGRATLGDAPLPSPLNVSKL